MFLSESPPGGRVKAWALWADWAVMEVTLGIHTQAWGEGRAGVPRGKIHP